VAQDRVVVTTNHGLMAYKIAEIRMTLILQRYSPTASLSKYDFFSYSCGADEKVSTDKVLRGPSAIAELFVLLVYLLGL